MLLAQTGTLARRAIGRVLRTPAEAVPLVAFPILFMAVTTAGAGRAADIPGFPAASYLDFYLAGALVQGALFGGISAGTALAVDIEEGFIRRLLLTPMRRSALLMSSAAGAAAIGAVQAAVLLGAGLIGGASVQTGIGGAIAVIGLAVLVALAFSSIGLFIGAWTGSSEATQVFFPLFFIMMIFSSFFMPRSFITAGWFRTVATYNPATYIIEALREPIIAGWDVATIGYGLLAAGGIAIVGFIGGGAALRLRLSRT